jgi:nucleoid DNA-binding protein
MTESDLAKALAKRLKTSNSQAADRVGRQLHEIVRQLRSGIPATLPGLGTLFPGQTVKTSLKPGKRR